jgi:hypothetical protein
MNQQQQFAIDYLREENRVLREQLGNRRLRLTNDQRRRLAAKAKRLCRSSDIPVTPVVVDRFTGESNSVECSTTTSDKLPEVNPNSAWLTASPGFGVVTVVATSVDQLRIMLRR